MSKKVYISENDLFNIKRFMAGEQTSHKPFIAEDEPPYEKDEFEIGREGGNNDFFHINESAHADLDIIDSISYSVDEKYYFDEEEYKHWYDNYDSEDEYLKSCERYDGEVYDTDGHHIDFFGGDRDEIEYYFRDNLYIAEKIFNKEGRYSQGEYWITDIQDEFVNEVDININDVDSVNKAAKRLSKPNGASQFILTDGSIIAFHDHAQIQSVCDGMTISKFLELGNIRCGGGNVVTIELIKQPTYEQQSTLKNLLAYADEAIVDFAEPNKNDNMYPEMVHSVTYKDPDNRRVVNDIMNYFWEGIKPISESKLVSKDKKVYIDENKLEIIKENIETEVEASESVSKNNKNTINEYHADQRLPFEEPEYANKFAVEQYKDWLEEFGRYGELPAGTLDFWDEIEKAIVKIKSEDLRGRFDKYDAFKTTFENIENKLIDIMKDLTVSKDNKVYVERMVAATRESESYSPYANMYDENGFVQRLDGNDFFNELVSDYGDNVGGCWSYKQGGSYSYCGDGAEKIVMRGFIRTDDIDFVKTVQLNFHYEREHEIRVKPFAQIELTGFTYGNRSITFNKHLIVNATYSGNNAKSVPSLTKVDDGFGNVKYFNRNRKEVTGEDFFHALKQSLANGVNPEKLFDNCGKFFDGIAKVAINDKYNFINQDGKLLWDYSIDQWFDTCDFFKYGFARVKLNGKWNLINQEGKIISDQWFDDCCNFKNGFAKVAINGKWNFINQDGKLLWDYPVEQWFDTCGYFKDGFARVKLNGKWNFINQECIFLSDQWFDYVDDFCGGFAWVKLNGKWNFINQEGKFLWDYPVEQWFSYYNDFKDGFAKVNLNGEWRKIDTNGKLLESKKANKSLIINENQLMRINENLESEVEAGEVKLDSFKKNDMLAPKLWDGLKLNSRARLKLLDIADDFWEYANISWVKPKGIHLTGSICNYNWSKFSDIDLHIVVDFSEIDERTDFIQEYFNSKKNEWNEEHSKLKIYGYPVELYVEDINAETVSNGLYDLERNKWITEPDKDSVKQIGLDKYEIKSKSAKLMTKIDDLCDKFGTTDDDFELREIGKTSNKLFNRIKRMRKLGLSRGGETDPFNIVYKVLRRSGYLENLWKLKSELYDKLNSIGVEENVISNYYNKFIGLNEEVVADGNADFNPFKQRWKHEREVLKDYLVNYGEIMTSKENGKEYKVLYDRDISNRVGINYCLCIQWNSITMEPGNIIYVRAFDKFTRRRFKPQFDTRGFDNIAGTADDVV